MPYQALPPSPNCLSSKGQNPDPPVTQPPSPESSNGDSMYMPDPNAGSRKLSPDRPGDDQVTTPPPAPRSYHTYYGT